MQRLPGILLLVLVAYIVNANNQNVDNGNQVEDSLDEFDEQEDHEGLRHEERRRPPKYPYCERTVKAGWGGKCSYLTQELVHYRCDFIWNNTYNPYGKQRQLCYDDNEACCVDCKAKKQTELCMKFTKKAVSRGYCCGNEMQVTPAMKSGCVCCKQCRRKQHCRLKRGHCVTEHDPVYNVTTCLYNGGSIKRRACTGYGCFCCIPAHKPINGTESSM
ncbi:unnamed protein product [Meganyctiphanes norvegica]|uniref:Uncharacterized protein n=1 Tax=Meganyctiphanes norvegica TaxID=48144 RepID=A0AAV2RT07_MEGNR